MKTQTLENNRQIQLAPGFCFLLAVALLTLPLNWCLAAAAAGLVHELCHILTLLLCGGRIHGSRIGMHGAEIRAAPLPAWKTLLCALAGPAGSFLLLFLASRCPEIAVCAAAQGIYNMLPLSGLDGCEILHAVLSIFLLPHQADCICTAADRICRFALLLLGFYGTFWLNLGISPLLVAAIVCMKDTGRKIPCK